MLRALNPYNKRSIVLRGTADDENDGICRAPGRDGFHGATPASAQQVACPVKIGGVLPLTGSMAPITKKIAEAAELAIEHINQGGGIKGCPVEFVLRDDQGQPTVGVDAAKYLVEVERVPAITGTVSSGVTGPDHLVGHGAVEGRADHLLLDRERRSRWTAAAAAISSAPFPPARRRPSPRRPRSLGVASRRRPSST